MLVLPKFSLLKFPLYSELASNWGSKHTKLKFQCKRKKPNYSSHERDPKPVIFTLKKPQTKLYQLYGWGLLSMVTLYQQWHRNDNFTATKRMPSFCFAFYWSLLLFPFSLLVHMAGYHDHPPEFNRCSHCTSGTLPFFHVYRCVL